MRNEFNNKLVSGDKVFFGDKPSSISFKLLEAYLQTKNCTRVKHEDQADKIVNNWNNCIGVKYINVRYTEIPTELPEHVINRHKSIHWTTLLPEILSYKDANKEKISFDYSIYENIWNLLNGKTDAKLALITTLSCDWTGNEFLLHTLILKFNPVVTSIQASKIPGWSEFGNYHKVKWKGAYYYASDVFDIWKKFPPTLEQSLLINKLLNQ